MQTIKVTVTAEIDGTEVEGFPIIQRLNLEETQRFNYKKVSGGGYTDLPAGELTNIQFLLLQPTQPITLRLNNQSDAGVVVGTNGLVLMLGVTINSGTNRARIDNNSGSEALVKGIAGGT